MRCVEERRRRKNVLLTSSVSVLGRHLVCFSRERGHKDDCGGDGGGGRGQLGLDGEASGGGVDVAEGVEPTCAEREKSLKKNLVTSRVARYFLFEVEKKRSRAAK